MLILCTWKQKLLLRVLLYYLKHLLLGEWFFFITKKTEQNKTCIVYTGRHSVEWQKSLQQKKKFL